MRLYTCLLQFIFNMTHCFYNISSVGIGTFNGWVKIFKLIFFAAFLSNYGASLVVQTVRNLPAMQETQVQSRVGKIPWRREWHLTPVCLSGEFHGQRSWVGYSPWSCKELDMTEWLTHVSIKKKTRWSQTLKALLKNKKPDKDKTDAQSQVLLL